MNAWKFYVVKEIRDNYYLVLLKNICLEKVYNKKYYYSKFSELEIFMKYFKVNKLDQLIDCIFESPEDDPLEALDLFKVQIKNNFKYVTPKDEELYDRAAEALSKMETPDFSDILKKDLLIAFNKIFSENNINLKWLERFTYKINKYSGKRIKLVKCLLKTNENGVNHFFLLSKNGEIKKIIIKPDLKPICFV
ncbi:hypothetical protein K9M42_00075 [Patescibacteria group bacterium]|nr:hypothetical protein [Patescibacteria group bacterium]